MAKEYSAKRRDGQAQMAILALFRSLSLSSILLSHAAEDIFLRFAECYVKGPRPLDGAL